MLSIRHTRRILFAERGIIVQFSSERVTHHSWELIDAVVNFNPSLCSAIISVYNIENWSLICSLIPMTTLDFSNLEKGTFCFFKKKTSKIFNYMQWRLLNVAYEW